MINLTEILTKPVLSLNCSKCEGIVKTGVFNQHFKRLKYLILFDNEEDFEDKALSVNSIYSNGENAIVIKDDQNLTPLSATTNILDKPSPINSKVFTFLGKFIGKVRDVVLTDSYFVHSIKVEDKEILMQDIISCGENTIIVQDEHKKAKISSLKRRKSNCAKIQDIKVSSNQKVYILSKSQKNASNQAEERQNDNISENINAIEPSSQDFSQEVEIINPILNSGNEINNEKPSASNLQEMPTLSKKPRVVYNLTEEPSQPGLVISNFEFLIGRKLEQNIYSSNNELIAKKNTKITTDTIIKARLFNKTRELVKFSH
ncbi:MAG: hypothetical protein ACI4TI_03990 [Christensenellales bacterium]